MSNEAPHNQFVYWVTYHFGDGSRSGFGGRRIFSPVPADSFLWLESTRQWIQDQPPHLGTVLIINWQRLEGDEHWEDKIYSNLPPEKDW